jgi:hypothetical protein
MDGHADPRHRTGSERSACSWRIEEQTLNVRARIPQCRAARG